MWRRAYRAKMAWPPSATKRTRAWEIPVFCAGLSLVATSIGRLSSASTYAPVLVSSDSVEAKPQTQPACDPVAEHEPRPTRPCSFCPPGPEEGRAAIMSCRGKACDLEDLQRRSALVGLRQHPPWHGRATLPANPLKAAISSPLS